MDRWAMVVIAAVQLVAGFGFFLGTLRAKSTNGNGESRRFEALQEQVQSLREVRAAERLSRLESALVGQQLCKERHHSITLEIQALDDRVTKLEEA